MNLETAKCQFVNLLSSIESDSTRTHFLDWVSSTYGDSCDDSEEADEKLKLIASDLRKCLPPSGLLPKEQILPPAAIDIAHTVHVDAFLYDDDVMDELFEAGKLSKFYCTKCESTTIKPLNIISHSMSREKLAFIFQSLLPGLDFKTVVDVGSRIGAVIFAAYFYSTAHKIIGIEMNEEFCQLQNNIIQKYKLSDRMSIIPGNVILHPDIIANGDVIFLHNVFEYFLPKSDEIRCWQFLRENITRSGVVIVAIPDIRISLNNLKVNGDEFIGSWLKKLPLEEIINENKNLNALKDISLYSVI